MPVSPVFTPFKTGRLNLKNRITMTPLFVSYGNPDGTVSRLAIDHYREMAASGAALIVVESAIIHESGGGTEFCLRADDDKYIPGLNQLASAIKEEGAMAFIQINHTGRMAMRDEDKLLAPSVLENLRGPKCAMSAEDIENAITWYAQAARRVKEAGFDGVEIHGATSYLIVQFLSPVTNFRTDEYGGSLENRMRFPLRVTDAVIQAVGDYPVGYRFIADELLPDGLHTDETAILAVELEKRGVEYLSVSCGGYDAFATDEYMEMDKKEGYMSDYAGIIKNSAASTPVVAAGRIQTPETAVRIIESGKADLIGLARVLFADPLWPRKASGEIQQPIVKCRPGCVNCMLRVTAGKPAFCAMWAGERRDAFKRRTADDL